MGLFSWLFGKTKALQTDQKSVVCDSENFGTIYTPPPAPPQVVTIEEVARDSAAQVVMQNSITSTSLDQTTIDKVKQAAAHSAAKGENPTHNKVASLLPGDFYWKEYDEWLERFEKEAVWPWEAACDLWEFNEEAELCSFDEMLPRLSKAELLDVAQRNNIAVHKSKAKAAIAEELAAGSGQSSDTQVKAMVIELVSAKLKAAAIREKKELFASWAQKGNFEKNKAKDWIKMGVTHFEVGAAPDCCPICEAKANRKISIATAKDEDFPPFYPGCRCSILPLDEDEEAGAHARLKSKYTSGEFPMKRCPLCKEWTAGNASVCTRCNKPIA